MHMQAQECLNIEAQPGIRNFYYSTITSKTMPHGQKICAGFMMRVLNYSQ